MTLEQCKGGMEAARSYEDGNIYRHSPVYGVPGAAPLNRLYPSKAAAYISTLKPEEVEILEKELNEEMFRWCTTDQHYKPDTRLNPLQRKQIRKVGRIRDFNELQDAIDSLKEMQPVEEKFYYGD